MTSEHSFEEKGKVKPKPSRETNPPRKENAPVTADPTQRQMNPATVQQLQQTVGNTAVQRFLAQRSGSGPTELGEETAETINRQRGSGQGLDEEMATKAGATMGHDFSDVTVHTDSQANQLSHQLGAKAFTTGSDIFFREGAYDPASSAGQQLIAHELTHVAQQGAAAPAVQGKMAVNDPHDQYEAEADQVANQVMTQPDSLQRQEEEEEMVQMQEEEELVQAQEMDEDEELQG
ncbi:MAG: DUF4157 domain-containing protein [Chloroflexota bacterium]